jgi:hypothetical protein
MRKVVASIVIGYFLLHDDKYVGKKYWDVAMRSYREALLSLTKYPIKFMLLLSNILREDSKSNVFFVQYLIVRSLARYLGHKPATTTSRWHCCFLN